MASTAVLASRWARLGAVIINMILLYAILFASGFIQLQVALMNGSIDQDPSRVLNYIMMMCLSSFILFCVQSYFLTTRGQSIGKMIFKIRVANVKTGESRGFVQNVLLRELLNGFLGFIPFYGLVDPLFIFRADKRCVHDLIAGTVVVKK